MLVWAARDLGRHPWQNLATALTLFGLALLLGGTQLTYRAFVETSTHLLAKAPAIVVRRTAATGWVPLPVDAALRAVKRVPGALAPRPRLWGLARVAGQTVTVVADLTASEPASGRLEVKPHPGEAIVAGGLEALTADGRLVFDGHPDTVLKVVRRLPDKVAMASHDTVLLHPDDARRLLGIPPGYASDLGIDLFHEEAASALARDLSTAFPWPVQVSTREATAGRTAALWERRSTLATLAYIPAVLALAVLGLAGVVGSERGRAQIGLLRALGWTGRDFLRLCLWRWGCLCLPAVGLGLAAAYGLTFAPGVRWPGVLLLGWTAAPPPFYLSSTGSALVLVQSAAVVALPHLAIVVATGLRHTARDPGSLLEAGLP
jgi:hypothetical protein